MRLFEMPAQSARLDRAHDRIAHARFDRVDLRYPSLRARIHIARGSPHERLRRDVLNVRRRRMLALVRQIALPEMDAFLGGPTILELLRMQGGSRFQRIGAPLDRCEYRDRL